MEITATQLATIIRGEIEGDGSVKISSYSKIEEAQEGSLSFLANPKYTHFVYTTKASVLLVRKDFVPEQPIKATLIKVDDPYATLAELLNLVQASAPVKSGVEQPVYVSDGVDLPKSIYLGAFSYIGKNAKIGENVKYTLSAILATVLLLETTRLFTQVLKYTRGALSARIAFSIRELLWEATALDLPLKRTAVI